MYYTGGDFPACIATRSIAGRFFGHKIILSNPLKRQEPAKIRWHPRLRFFPSWLKIYFIHKRMISLRPRIVGSGTWIRTRDPLLTFILMFPLGTDYITSPKGARRFPRPCVGVLSFEIVSTPVPPLRRAWLGIALNLIKGFPRIHPVFQSAFRRKAA